MYCVDPVLDHTDLTVVKVAQEAYSKLKGKYSSDPLHRTASQVPEEEAEDFSLAGYSNNRPSQKTTPMKSDGNISKKASGVPNSRAMDAERPPPGASRKD